MIIVLTQFSLKRDRLKTNEYLHMNNVALWPEKDDKKKNKAKIFWCVNHTDTFLFFENTTKTDN